MPEVRHKKDRKRMATDKNDLGKRLKNLDWDFIQRLRFMNADAEIAPDDRFTRALKNKRKNKKDND